jgi:hypothetical protein
MNQLEVLSIVIFIDVLLCLNLLPLIRMNLPLIRMNLALIRMNLPLIHSIFFRLNVRM